MAGRTERFGFNTFGGGEGGSISDDGFKFSSDDRRALDAILAAIERHNHHLVAHGSSEAPGAPSVTVGADGYLEGGFEYFYRVALLNEDGSVGEAGDEASITLPAVLQSPDIPAVANIEGSMPVGSLLPGVYYYGLTAHVGIQESPLSATVPAQVIATGSVRLELPEFEDPADSYTVWRMGPGEPGFTRIGITDLLEFIDDGSVPADPCAGSPGHTPPDFNTGAAVYSVVVSLPAGLEAPFGWVIYRTDTSGLYDGQCVVERVTAFVDEDDPESGVVTSWSDVGDPLQGGTPRTVEDIRFVPFTFDARDELPDPAGFPDWYPIVHSGKLLVRSGLEWIPLGGGSGSVSLPIFTSPNGSRFIQSVSDDGEFVLTPTELPGPPAPVVVSVIGG